MKRGLALILTFALIICLLTSCIDRGNDASFAPSNSGPLPDEPTALDCDRSFLGNTVEMCSTENTVYIADIYSRSGLLRYVDKATGLCLPLCGRPECLHNDSTCNAYYGMTLIGLSNYDGRLYWVRYDTVDHVWCIYSAAYDGTDHRMVRTLDRQTAGNGFNEPSLQYHRGILYWGCTTEEVIDGQATHLSRVFAFPLNPNQEGFVIFEGETSGYVRIQVYQNSLYIANCFGDNTTSLALYRWDIEAQKLETLYYGKTSFSWDDRTLWVTENGILIYGTVSTSTEENKSYDDNIYKFSFENGEFELLYRFSSSVQGSRYNLAAADGKFIGTMVTEAGNVVLQVKDFEGQTILDVTFVNTDLSLGQECGTDETYMYFYNGSKDYYTAVPWDGSEIKLLWSSDAESY